MTTRIAIVHDYLVQYGGAERVVEALHELWPEAPVYTSMYDPDRMPATFGEMDVRTSFLQRAPAFRRRFKLALPLYPAAMSSFDLSGYDTVLSSSSGWAHGVRTGADTRHVVYCHTPARWLYRPGSYVRNERWTAAPLLPLLRRWDKRAAARADNYIANSQGVRERIAQVYARLARVVYPPVDTDRFSLARPDGYYLCVSRLNPYKRIDLAIRACERLGRSLLVAGDGPARRELTQVAGRRTELLGRVSDADVASLLSHCRALIVPAEEDFCITAVEAMASGRPVIGYARGGLVETVVPERTGVLFPEATEESLERAIGRLERLELEPAEIRRHALRYDTRSFQARMSELVEGPDEREVREVA